MSSKLNSLFCGSFVPLLCWPLLAAMPSAAQDSAPAAGVQARPSAGSVEVTSLISEVDACNRAQSERPQGATVTAMHYWRSGEEGKRSVTCRVSWSTSSDARRTYRPILFGPTY